MLSPPHPPHSHTLYSAVKWNKMRPLRRYKVGPNLLSQTKGKNKAEKNSKKFKTNLKLLSPPHPQHSHALYPPVKRNKMRPLSQYIIGLNLLGRTKNKIKSRQKFNKIEDFLIAIKSLSPSNQTHKKTFSLAERGNMTFKTPTSTKNICSGKLVICSGKLVAKRLQGNESRWEESCKRSCLPEKSLLPDCNTLAYRKGKRTLNQKSIVHFWNAWIIQLWHK